MAVKHAPRILFIVIAVFALAAFAGCGSDSSNPASPTIDTAPPAIPGGVSAWAQIGNRAKITLAWDSNVTDADLAGYVVYRSLSESSGYRSVSDDLLNSNGYSDENLATGKLYYYRVAARDASGNESGLSQSISIDLPTGNGDGVTIADGPSNK
jgi:fibronectin type 3 domain-containing protein